MTGAEQTYLRLGTGAPLVVIPGLTGRGGLPVWVARWMQRRQLRGFAGVFDTWRIDRGTDLVAGSTIADIADDYAATLRSLFTGPVDIVGISTGGSIALQLAADAPELVKRLVIVSSAHRLGDDGRDVQRATAALIRAGHPRRAAAVFLSHTGTSTIAKKILALVGFVAHTVVLGKDDPDLLVMIDAEDRFDLENRLDAIPVPTLIAGGDRDDFYPASMFARTASGIPRAELLMYAKTGHMGTPAGSQLTRDVIRFLAEPRADAA